MRVALELQPCCGKRSGIGVYTYELARRLKNQNGLEFCGNVFNFLGRNDNAASLQGIEMPVRECRTLPYGMYRRLWHRVPLSYGTFFPDDADVNLFFNYIVPPRVGGKAIAAIHDMTYLRFPETMETKNLRRIERDIAYSIDRSSQIITVSQFSKQEIVELLGVPEERVSVVYNAPSVSDETEECSSLMERYGIRKPYLLYVGTIEPRKNLLRLLRAFARLKREEGIPHQLVLAGGSGWNNGEIYETARSLSCNHEVIFTGYISEREKNTLYSHADLFVFPSLYEGFGIPPLEAMHFGCPVVCADAASLPEVVGNTAELVNPMDELSIAQGIHRMLSDEARRAERIEQGYRRAKLFSWEASAQRLIQVCKEVCGQI